MQFLRYDMLSLPCEQCFSLAWLLAITKSFASLVSLRADDN